MVCVYTVLAGANQIVAAFCRLTPNPSPRGEGLCEEYLFDNAVVICDNLGCTRVNGIFYFILILAMYHNFSYLSHPSTTCAGSRTFQLRGHATSIVWQNS